MFLFNYENHYFQVEEALDKVKLSIQTLKDFKTCFKEYKEKCPSYFTGDQTPKSWEFQVGVVNICDAFVKRKLMHPGATDFPAL